MANSLGTLSVGRLSMRVIDYLKEMFPPVLRMYLSFTNERARLSETITTRIPGAPAAYDVTSAGYASQNVTDTDKTVTLNRFYATSMTFTAVEMSKTDRMLVDEHAAAAANALGAQLMDHFFAVILASAFTNNTVEQAVDYDDDTIRAIAKKFANRKVPLLNSIGVVNADAWEALTGDSLVVSTDSNPNAHQMFLGTARHRQRGFDIFQYAQLPDNSENLNGVFVSPGGIIGATAIPRDANEDGFWPDVPRNAAVVPRTDPDTGITLLERRTRRADGGAQVDLAWIYGFAAGDPARLERVTEV